MVLSRVENTLIFGLSRENIRRMQEEDKPMLFTLEQLGVPMQVLIVAGETEDSIAEMMTRSFQEARREHDHNLDS